MRRALELLRSARFAPALPCADALARVLAETGVNFERARARTGFARGHLLQVVLYLPGGSGAARESAAGLELVRLLIGEELCERWVSQVSALPTVRGGALTVINDNSEEHAALPIDELYETVRVAVSGLRSGLPPLPAAASDSADWVLFELEPAAELDYAAQDDLLFCSTRLPELKKSFLRGEPFFSGRFSADDALFAYLKYESSELAPEVRLTERSQFEEAAACALGAERGALVGLGFGLRYGYLDFALRDPNCATERLLTALRAAGIGRRAWLLFYDTELERHFVPVYPDSPEPYWGGS